MLTDLTVDEVRALFTYDKEDGIIRLKNASGRYGRYPAGSPAGQNHPEGYRYVRIGEKLYRVSRLIWLHVTGEWPKHQVDHKDLNPSNDKWENLREATSSQNKANCGKYKAEKASCHLKGVQAVQKRRSIRYRAIATKDGVRQHLGYFGTPEEAHAAYLKASEELHGEFANDGTRKLNDD